LREGTNSEREGLFVRRGQTLLGMCDIAEGEKLCQGWAKVGGEGSPIPG